MISVRSCNYRTCSPIFTLDFRTSRAIIPNGVLNPKMDTGVPPLCRLGHGCGCKKTTLMGAKFLKSDPLYGCKICKKGYL